MAGFFVPARLILHVFLLIREKSFQNTFHLATISRFLCFCFSNPVRKRVQTRDFKGKISILILKVNETELVTYSVFFKVANIPLRALHIPTPTFAWALIYANSPEIAFNL